MKFVPVAAYPVNVGKFTKHEVNGPVQIVKTFRILRIKNAKFLGYCFCMNTNI